MKHRRIFHVLNGDLLASSAAGLLMRAATEQLLPTTVLPRLGRARLTATMFGPTRTNNPR